MHETVALLYTSPDYDTDELKRRLIDNGLVSCCITKKTPQSYSRSHEC